MKQPILFGSIDQGTTSTRFILYEYNIFNHDLKKLLVHQIEHDNIYPKPGWVEQDPMELMKNTVICIDTVIRQFCEEHKIPLENSFESTIFSSKNSQSQKKISQLVNISEVLVSQTKEKPLFCGTKSQENLCSMPLFGMI